VQFDSKTVQFDSKIVQLIQSQCNLVHK